VPLDCMLENVSLSFKSTTFAHYVRRYCDREMRIAIRPLYFDLCLSVIKAYMSNLVHTTRFWNSVHHVRS